MSRNTSVFDHTLEVSGQWIKSLDRRLMLDDPHASYTALRAGLHALRDRLPQDGVLGLSAQSPMLIRGLLLDGWTPHEGPSHVHSAETFASNLERRLPRSFPRTGRHVAEAVFALLAERLDPGEVRKLKGYLPEDIRTLWSASAARHDTRRPAPAARPSGRLPAPALLLAFAALLGVVSLGVAEFWPLGLLGRGLLVYGALGLGALLAATAAALFVAR